MWKVEPRNCPTATRLKTAHLPGWPAPLQPGAVGDHREICRYRHVRQACAGKSTKEVIADAQTQLKQIYKQA